MWGYGCVFIYKCGIFLLNAAAQGFWPRRTLRTSQAINPRRTKFSGKSTIYK
jgi:hypothetical protein